MTSSVREYGDGVHAPHDRFCEQVLGVGRPCSGDDAVFEGNKVGYCATLLREAREAKRAHFDGAAASACVAAVASASPPLSDRRMLHELSERLEPCRRVVVGEQGVAAPCSRTMECKPGLVCASGTCLEPKAASEACVALREDGVPAARSTCRTGLRCEAGRCAAPAEAGAACTTSDGCAPGLACRAQRCAARDPSAAGGACTTSADCAAGLYCAPKPHTCAAHKPAGEACDAPDSCMGLCSREAGNRCRAYCGSG